MTKVDLDYVKNALMQIQGVKSVLVLGDKRTKLQELVYAYSRMRMLEERGNASQDQIDMWATRIENLLQATYGNDNDKKREIMEMIGTYRAVQQALAK